MSRWTEDDPGSSLSVRLTDYASRPVVKWTGLFVAWVLVTALLAVTHLTLLIWPIMVVLIWYVVREILQATPRAHRRQWRHRQEAALQAAAEEDDLQFEDSLEFNAPPGWPPPPAGWTPPRGWQPNPSWPPAPRGWRFWVPPGRSRDSARERTMRPLPRDW